MKHNGLEKRMREYEDVFRFYLPKRMPVIIRVDGRAFHTFTRGFQRPFDEVLRTAMQLTAKKLCEEVSGCKLAYVQSDEISLLVTNDDSVETQPWFGNGMWKLVSLTASIATLEFNKILPVVIDNWGRKNLPDWDEGGTHEEVDPELLKRLEAYGRGVGHATFDSRAFVLPKEEVCNYFIWRQQDAVRNSIQMVAQSLYSHRELQDKDSAALQEMIFQKGVNWNDYPIDCKRGACVIRTEKEVNGVLRHKWDVDIEIPTFTKDRSYIEGRLTHEKDH